MLTTKQAFKRVLLLAPLAMAATLATAQTPATMPPELGVCVTCHGTKGLSQLPNAPHIAGHPEMYITEQLKAYRSGKRQNEIMGVIAKPLTDAQIEVAARWYSAVKITVLE